MSTPVRPATRLDAVVPGSALTAREIDVVRAVSAGLTNTEIGQRLFLAETTVKTHLQRIARKLGVSDRTAIVVMAHRTGQVLIAVDQPDDTAAPMPALPVSSRALHGQLTEARHGIDVLLRTLQDGAQ